MAGKNDLLFDKPKLVNGGQSQEAIVVTSPDKQHVNAPTVEDIQRIAKGIAEKEAEAASATEWEKSVKDKVYYDSTNEQLNFETKFGYVFAITDTNTFFKFELGDNDELTFDFSYLQLGRDDISRIFIDTDEETMRVPYLVVDDIYDIDESHSVNTVDLMDGNRIYKHVIIIQFDSNHFFKFEYYNSDPTPIEDVDTIAYDKSFECCSGMYYDNSVQPNTKHVAVIEEIDVGDIHILYGDTSLLLENIEDVIDTVYQL